jgi:hypothetical protein
MQIAMLHPHCRLALDYEEQDAFFDAHMKLHENAKGFKLDVEQMCTIGWQRICEQRGLGHVDRPSQLCSIDFTWLGSSGVTASDCLVVVKCCRQRRRHATRIASSRAPGPTV